jgi:hypothetical protein
LANLGFDLNKYSNLFNLIERIAVDETLEEAESARVYFRVRQNTMHALGPNEPVWMVSLVLPLSAHFSARIKRAKFSGNLDPTFHI